MARFPKMNKLPRVSSVGDSEKIELANVDGAKLNSVSGSDISPGPLARCSHGCRELPSGFRHLRKKSTASKSCYTKCSLMVSLYMKHSSRYTIVFPPEINSLHHCRVLRQICARAQAHATDSVNSSTTCLAVSFAESASIVDLDIF